MLKIGPYDYRIEFASDIRNDDDERCAGMCIYERQLIRLDNDMSQQAIESALLHEVLHALDDMFRIGLTEHQVSVLAPALLMVLRDNGLLEENDPE